MIKFTHRGSFRNTERFFRNARTVSAKINAILLQYAQMGVSALAAVTPVDTGATAMAWAYEISSDSKGYIISWTNSSIEGGVPIVILLQYGHATKGGGYVQGRDFINPAIRPIFDQIAEKAWKEVTK